jgi:branched-chain amino acid transport system substrate-binding protein
VIKVFGGLLLAVAMAMMPALVRGADMPGVTATEIKVGATFPFSGPASSLASYGKGVIAYVNSINDRGGIHGRKIDLIALDDAYSPPKAVEQTRRLVENEEVAFIFSALGTASNSATVRYLNAKKVPGLFIVSGAVKFTNATDYPYTTTAVPSYATEGRVIAEFISTSLPGEKIGLLYQNDDLGKDFVAAFKEYFKESFDQRVVTSPYEVTQPTVDSQILSLKAAGVTALFIAGGPKIAAQSIRKSHAVGWKPLIVITSNASSVSATLAPAGLDVSVGVVSASFYKDPNDPKWKDDPGVKAYQAHFAKYLPGADIGDTFYLTGTQQGQVLEAVLEQCGDDLSRENINLQAHNIKNLVLPTFLAGVQVNTSPSNNQAVTQLKLRRWTGTAWEEFGEVTNGTNNQ